MIGFFKESNKFLDTLSDVRNLKYKLRIFEERKIGYAEVRVILFEDSVELDVVDISFMAFDTPTPCKVEFFDFTRYLKSNKIDVPPPIIK